MSEEINEQKLRDLFSSGKFVGHKSNSTRKRKKSNKNQSARKIIKAPFPYYGGKSRISASVWNHLKDPDIYVEPFLGSGAVILGRPNGPGKREIVCDVSGGICNFYRAVKSDYNKVIEFADLPTIHQDLTARHKWLVKWFFDNHDRLSKDPEFYSAKAAGWWVWGISNWVGSGWCEQKAVSDSRPFIQNSFGGQGVSRQILRSNVKSIISLVGERFKNVIVLNTDWKQSVTDRVLMKSKGYSVGIFMDPPYKTEKRSTYLYGSDINKTSDTVAEESFRWAVSNGEIYKIAYCCHKGDFQIPNGWRFDERKFRTGRLKDAGKSDVVMFSPACF